MKTHATHAITKSVLALALALPLAACGQSGQGGPTAETAGARTADATPAAPSESMIAAGIRKGIEEAKRELATEDLDLDAIHVGHDRHDREAHGKAVITPQGDLVIAGNTVQATPAQHSMLLDYRRQMLGIAEAGMEIGARGADLGTRAAKEALWAVFTGRNDKDLEARIKPQAERIKAAAVELCGRMPGLLASQQQLAAALPEFRPYANLTQKDVDDCGKHKDDD